ncbi:MAG: ADP-ribosylglycohydrolase family protein [Acutalibacteraceae bacterium]|jgi:ADP-ribosylglycohydrolase
MIRFNQKALRDRIYACWVGKNIGGTMGTPFEGAQQLNDIQGFSTPEGTVLPNDDLDLQLVWLRAVDEHGPEAIDSKLLGEYWCSYVGPCWNEYGVGKANLREGLLPPLSGAMNNEKWMNSNGAWIRTEIWACLYPGNPVRAVRMAYEDACVDHGIGEGTAAAMFVAAMESAAFVLRDLRALIRIGLASIPENCRVAQSVRLVCKAFDDGEDWKTARQLLVEDSADLGWFQAPANVAFVLLGMLYGGGDFKKSMILAINCGDDTDCTGATLGSLFGILYGMEGIPQDWRRHIGDKIETLSIIKGNGYFPRTCTELTDCVMSLIPAAARPSLPDLIDAPERTILFGDEAEDFSAVTEESLCSRALADEVFSCSPFSFTAQNAYVSARIEFEREPYLSPEKPLTGKVTLTPVFFLEQRHYHLRWFVPDGVSVSCAANLYTNRPGSPRREHASAEFTFTTDRPIGASVRAVLEITCDGRPTALYASATVLG